MICGMLVVGWVWGVIIYKVGKGLYVEFFKGVENGI